MWEVRMALLAGGFSLKELTEVSSCSPGSEMGVLEGWMGREGDGGGGGRSGQRSKEGRARSQRC